MRCTARMGSSSCFFFSSRRRHTRCGRDWSSDVCSSDLIRALGLVKKAAAQTNSELGLLSKRRASAIARAAQEVIDGKLDDQFPIDIYQTGSGTSTNTNANEVIANRATEILGGKRGSKLVHPDDHVQLCQSSNDVNPTAIHVSLPVA